MNAKKVEYDNECERCPEIKVNNTLRREYNILKSRNDEALKVLENYSSVNDGTLTELESMVKRILEGKGE